MSSPKDLVQLNFIMVLPPGRPPIVSETSRAGGTGQAPRRREWRERRSGLLPHNRRVTAPEPPSHQLGSRVASSAEPLHYRTCHAIPRRSPCPRQTFADHGDDGTRHGAEGRSEEHTSELQSPCNLVCRLLLEKKKKITI